ncbi:MAG: hypothetical protein APR63_04225 [Desulfuromonas sp. SDB]|nr:MAG: hypothetical protein APR63_04225 [Desulfuromonas sp. SDB]
MNKFTSLLIIFLILMPLSIQGYDISSWLDEDSIVYEQPEPNTWIIPYNSSQGGTISVGVLSVEEKWIMIMVPLFELPDEYPSQAFMQLAQANYQMNQMKLGLSEENYIFLQMEIPYRLVNKQELIDNIEFIAYAVDENLETIASWFGLSLE